MEWSGVEVWDLPLPLPSGQGPTSSSGSEPADSAATGGNQPVVADAGTNIDSSLLRLQRNEKHLPSLFLCTRLGEICFPIRVCEQPHFLPSLFSFERCCRDKICICGMKTKFVQFRKLKI